MATEIATAYVQVVPTTQGISAALEEQFTQSGDTAGAGFSDGLLGGMDAGTAALATAAGAAAAAAVKAAWDTMNELAEYGDEIDKQSQKLGISAQAYQEWGYVLEHNGSSIDAMTAGMRTMTLAATQNAGAFEAVGISQEALANMSPEEMFSASIAGLQNVEDVAERTALAYDLFGRSATELGPLLNQSSEETDDMRQRLHNLGGALSDEDVKNAAAFEDAMTDLSTAWRGLKQELAAPLMPIFTAAINGLAYFVGAVASEMQPLEESAKIGDGHDLQAYEDNVAALREECDRLNEEWQTLAAAGADYSYSMNEWSEACMALQYAEEELAEKTAEAAMAAEEAANAMGSESDAASWLVEAAMLRETEAYQTAYEAAYNSITGQIGLFGEFAATLDESVDTTDEMMQRWAEQTAAMETYAQNLNLADAYGLAPELIAQLSDGSAESAAVLQQIVSEISAVGAGSEEAAAIVDGLNSSFAGMEAAKDTLADTAAFGQLGELNGQAYVEGLQSQESAAGSAGDALADAAGSPMDSASGYAYGWGADMGSNFASGLSSQTSAVSAAANELASAAAAPLQHSVPKEGPLAHDDEWGFHMMDNFISGIRGSEAHLRDTLHGALDVGDVTLTGSAEAGGLVQVVSLLAAYLPQLATRRVQLDDGAIIGRYVPQVDAGLGDTRSMARRGLAT